MLKQALLVGKYLYHQGLHISTFHEREFIFQTHLGEI